MAMPMMSPALANALTMALDDEYRARATYQAVLDTFGPVWPFVNIVQAEQRHIEALTPLFYRYGVMPPADRWSGNVLLQPTLAENCRAAVTGEINNYSMYDRLLQQVVEPDVRFVFSNLRNASAYHHLPAFQVCAGSDYSSVQVPALASAQENNQTSVMQTMALGAVAGVGLTWLLSRALKARA